MLHTDWICGFRNRDSKNKSAIVLECDFPGSCLSWLLLNHARLKSRSSPSLEDTVQPGTSLEWLCVCGESLKPATSAFGLRVQEDQITGVTLSSWSPSSKHSLCTRSPMTLALLLFCGSQRSPSSFWLLPVACDWLAPSPGTLWLWIGSQEE